MRQNARGKNMATTARYNIPEGLTLETLWEQFYASREEYDRRFELEKAQRQQEEAERRKEEAERKKELDRIIGKLGNRFGELVEHR